MCACSSHSLHIGDPGQGLVHPHPQGLACSGWAWGVQDRQCQSRQPSAPTQASPCIFLKRLLTFPVFIHTASTQNTPAHTHTLQQSLLGRDLLHPQGHIGHYGPPFLTTKVFHHILAHRYRGVPGAEPRLTSSHSPPQGPSRATSLSPKLVQQHSRP